MEDLIKKVEELRDLLKGMTSMIKPKQSLVPAIKAPTIKPLSVGAAPAAASKIPGVAPPSNKDPVKMAQQLKNPRPKKPKMEILKSDKNGQWELIEKRWSDEDAKWVYDKEMESAKAKIEHTNTNQRGVKAYTTAAMGTAEEQANRSPHSGAAGPVKHIPIAQHLAERAAAKKV